jgi:hypothetical protein
MYHHNSPTNPVNSTFHSKEGFFGDPYHKYTRSTDKYRSASAPVVSAVPTHAWPVAHNLHPYNQPEQPKNLTTQPKPQLPSPPASQLSEEQACSLIQRAVRRYFILRILDSLKLVQQEDTNANQAYKDFQQEKTDHPAQSNRKAKLAPYKAFEEKLTKILLKVDGIPTLDSNLLREKRRTLVRKINRMLQENDALMEKLASLAVHENPEPSQSSEPVLPSV